LIKQAAYPPLEFRVFRHLDRMASEQPGNERAAGVDRRRQQSSRVLLRHQSRSDGSLDRSSALLRVMSKAREPSRRLAVRSHNPLVCVSKSHPCPYLVTSVKNRLRDACRLGYLLRPDNSLRLVSSGQHKRPSFVGRRVPTDRSHAIDDISHGQPPAKLAPAAGKRGQDLPV
jgi:hypothetical protein